MLFNHASFNTPRALTRSIYVELIFTDIFYRDTNRHRWIIRINHGTCVVTFIGTALHNH